MRSPRRTRLTAGIAAAAALVMVGMSFAAVPLYKVFCEATGFAGTPKVEAAAPTRQVDRTITVRFNADTAQGLPWKFAPAQGPMTIRLGETALAEFRAKNLSDRPIVGVATFNVTPYKAGEYFAKIACFCFNAQRLEPGEEVSMPVTFYVDPAIADDPSTRDVTAVTLSYTFFESDVPRASASRAEPDSKLN
ncbi:MAG: cytochrome c oxidase assembly protein [Gemmatimonas sp.]